MKFVNLSDLLSDPQQVLNDSATNDLVLVSEGKPRAVIRGLTEDEFIDYLIHRVPGLLVAQESDLSDWEHFLGQNPWADEGLRKARGQLMENPGISINLLLKKRKQDRRDYDQSRLWLQGI